MHALEEQFDEFLHYCRKQQFTSVEMEALLQPLRAKNWPKRKAVWCGALVVVSALGCAYLWSNWLAWLLSAVGRLLLIQLLPYWDWTSLYNAKCLVARASDGVAGSVLPPLGKHETQGENCMLCATMTELSTLNNVTYAHLESSYLESGLPVIVQASHAIKRLPTLLHELLNAADDTFLQSVPCDLATNLMLKKFFTIDLALQKLQAIPASGSWFLQLRNCRHAAVKASRAFVTRPYYYPHHLAPFYSSWLIMAHNYQCALREIYLQGLIFVQQLHGAFNINLKPKQPCATMCPSVNLRLLAGEALVFSTDLWIFSYGSEYADAAVPAIATILEIDWHA